MNPGGFPSSLELPAELVAELFETALATARANARRRRDRRRPCRGRTLRPGSGTPLWNELVRHCAVQLRRWGEKPRLARVLGVPRQRVHEFLVGRAACADAERTLHLLRWLSLRTQGRNLS